MLEAVVLRADGEFAVLDHPRVVRNELVPPVLVVGNVSSDATVSKKLLQLRSQPVETQKLTSHAVVSGKIDVAHAASAIPGWLTFLFLGLLGTSAERSGRALQARIAALETRKP